MMRPDRKLSSAILLLCLALAGCLPLHTQDLRFYREQAWSTEQGLPQDTVHQILQTRDGFLWIATEGGLARYDGASFTVFNHLNEKAFSRDDICCLAQDNAGDLWIGTSEGLIRRRADRFEQVNEPGTSLAPAISGLAAASDGTLAVLTDGSLLRVNNGRLQPVPNVPPGIEAIQSAGDGGLWLLANGRVFTMKAGAVTALALKGSAPGVRGIAAALPRGFWTFTNTTVHLEAGNSTRDWTAGRDLPGSRVESFFVDREGFAWVGTNNGVTVLDPQNKQPKSKEFLHGDTVLQTFQDAEGSFWIGTENSGLHLLRRLKFRPLLNNVAVRALVQATDRAVWVGTRDDGLRRIDAAEGISEPVPSARLTSPVILSLAPGAGGSLWAGTPDGLNHVSPDGKVQQITSADGLPDDYIQALTASPDGGVWIGTRRGLVHLRGSEIEVLSKENGLPGDLVGTLLLTAGGELWMGTSGGLSRRLPDGKIINYGALGQGVIAALAEDAEGAIWIVTSSGDLSRFASGTLQPIGRHVFQGQVQGLVADAQGDLWSRDLRGIERVSLAELKRCAAAGAKCTPHPSTYGQAEGVPSDETITGGSPAILRLANGEIWAVTRRGLAITDPQHMPYNHVPPPLAIESLRVDDTTLAAADGEPKIPFGHTRFTFDYAALSFMVPSAVHYRVKLEGLDPQWIDAGGRRSATYTNLPPRTYRFRVQAANNDGVWNEAGATLPFQIVPPFYRRWWFVLLLILLSGSMVVGAYLLRLRVLRRNFDLVLTERNRLAREIHDTLAQDFVGISLQLDIVSQLLGGKKLEAAVAQVQQTRNLVTEGLAEARQSIWELRANATQDSLPSRLRKIVKRYANDALLVHLKINGAFRPLDPRLEGEVLRIAQEAVSNVQRHSGATAATVELGYGSDMLVLTIEDNGRGFAPELAGRAQERFGLSGMKERADLLGAALDITSSPGEGTTVRLTMKIDSAKRGTAWKLESK